MGTKVRRDLATNANVIHEPVWPELAKDGDKVTTFDKLTEDLLAEMYTVPQGPGQHVSPTG